MRTALEGLEPKALWQYFEFVSEIPRCSGNEEKIREALVRLAQEKHLNFRQDKIGNLVICLNATAGHENRPTVILQGHLDMVCEKNNDHEHNFQTQGIEIERDGEWLKANGTTLGADNGIAVAAALALIDDPPPMHGPIELLFTIDEERGLTGAANIESNMITGKTLLNLDSEEEGFVTVGCAGGGDTNIVFNGTREETPISGDIYSIYVKGLTGGHSGMDIIHNRANSIRCLARVLDEIWHQVSTFRIASIQGGNMRNAIPREASATFVIDTLSLEAVEELCRKVKVDFKAEFQATDPNLDILVEAKSDTTVPPFGIEQSKRIISLLVSTPSGVVAMNRDILGLVETSNNLGVIETKGNRVRVVNCTRSSVKPALEAVRKNLRNLGEALEAEVDLEAGYPGWKPNLDSKILAVFKQVHQELLGKEPEVVAIHAGLECGIIGECFPGMDMISFGPDMEGVHTPSERLNIPSTVRFFDLLKKVLASVS